MCKLLDIDVDDINMHIQHPCRTRAVLSSFSQVTVHTTFSKPAARSSYALKLGVHMMRHTKHPCRTRVIRGTATRVTLPTAYTSPHRVRGAGESRSDGEAF